MNRNFKFLFLMIIAMTIWGGSWVCAKAISHNLHFQQLAFVRFLLTFLFFLPPVLMNRERLLIDKTTALKIFTGSLFYTLYSQAFFLGLSLGTAGLGGVLVTSLVPVVTFGFMIAFTGKRLGKRDAAGLIIGLIGTLIIIKIWSLSIDKLFTSGNLFFIAGGVLWAGVTINSQKTQSRVSIWTYSFYLNGFAVLLQAFFTLPHGINSKIFPAEFSFWMLMIYLSLVSTVFATSVYFFAAKHIGSHKASVFTFLVPLSAVILSWIFLHETPELTTIIGGVFSSAAVYLIHFSTPPDDLNPPE
ncbi:MAG: DMT family transporter [Spirochaetota bacterium]